MKIWDERNKIFAKTSSVEILFQFNGGDMTIIGENSIMCSKDDLCQKKIHYIFRNPGFPSAATDLATCNYNVQKSDSGM